MVNYLLENSEEAIDLLEFKQSLLQFKYINNEFHHNFNRDIQFVILWEKGRYMESEVINKISEEFNILYCTNVTWSDINKVSNLNRLYSARIGSKGSLSKHEEVGMGDFLCIVFEDLKPKYEYVQSLGKEVFIGNVNAVNNKYELRDLLGSNLVHGTSSISEFFHHASLIFHEDKLKEIVKLKEWDNNIYQLSQDMAGANGWSSFQEMMSIANYCSRWVILRNHEYLPNDFWENDKDLDVLCDNLNSFSTAINAIKSKGSISAYETKVEGKDLPVDIRFVGDFYYDPIWEDKMLNRRTYRNDIIPVLRDDDYFFSLLYHSKLQKPAIKDIYIPRLIELGKKIGIKNINEEFLFSDEEVGLLINGYLKSQTFCFYKPNDKQVYLNKEVYLYISARQKYEKVSIKGFMAKSIAKIIPPSIKPFIKKIIPKSIKYKLRN